ncbi:MAG: 16S rRNA processing protein RimM [Bacteriovoracaceae bacterium]|nr:16S rRNA processing protein RimM [Bacteriovoracaceae bacterium]
MSDEKSAVKLGECHKPHGIKGGFLLHLYNTNESCLKPNVSVSLLPLDERSQISQKGRTLKIKSIQFSPKTICYFQGIEDRNEVEAMLPFEIYVDRELLPKTKQGVYYVHDLLSAQVFVNNELIGTIRDFYTNASEQVIFVIKTASDEIDIPFTKEFFLEVNVAEKKVIVNLPEYI